MTRAFLICGLALGAATMFGCGKQEEPARPVAVPTPAEETTAVPPAPANPAAPPVSATTNAVPEMATTEPATETNRAAGEDPEALLTAFSEAIQARDYDKAGDILKGLVARKSEFTAAIQAKIDTAESTLNAAKKASAGGLGDLTPPPIPVSPEEPMK
jgi:hypothetical protein